MTETALYHWMPGPSYLCRRKLVLELLDEIKPESVLEIGFGGGDLIRIMNEKGYKGAGVDFSEDACASLRARFEGKPFNFRIEAMSEEGLDAWREKFGLVMAFEVLEHIEKDTEALRRWARLTADGGLLLLSVPAHAKKFSAEDLAAGHTRRYERDELRNKLADAGFSVLKFYSYGYPLLNLSGLVRRHLAPAKKAEGLSMEQRSKEIGKGLVFWRLGKYLFNDITMFPAYVLQKLFLGSDLGDGYLVLAKKAK